MGFLDALRGRRRPAQPDLDSLFAVPTAAITLQAAVDAVPTGRGAAVFRVAEGTAFADVAADVQGLLDADAGPPVQVIADEFGYTWLVVTTEPADLAAVVTDLHAVNRTLVDSGFGPQLLCSVVGFTVAGAPLHLIYLAKRGSFYPFAPVDAERRNQVLELQVADLVGSDLPLEADRGRWFALWGAPI